MFWALAPCQSDSSPRLIPVQFVNIYFFQSSKAIILPGEMKFWQFHKRSLEKFWLWQDLNLYLLDTRWVLWSAMKPHNLGPMHILEGFSFPWRNVIKIFTSMKNWNLFLAYTVVIFIKNGLTFSSVFPIFNFQEWTLFGCGIW